jgi:transcriptional regulator with XRE-family HTH domain
MDRHDLRRRREALDLSQEQLGQRLGVMQNTVSRWELGLVVIRHPEIIDLALRWLEHEQRERGAEDEGRRELAEAFGDG